MRTAGTLLKDERLKMGFTLEQVEQATRIRSKFLLAIEADDYKKMPALPYVQGFIKNYSDFLGLKSTTILAIFRRQYTQKEKELRESIEEPLTKSYWITRNKVIILLLSILVVALFSYFYLQFRALHTAPPLLIEQPANESIVQTEEIAVFGKTDPDATLTINNEPVLVKEDGKFYKDITLNSGINTLVIQATSRVGEKTSITRKITRTE